MKKIDNKYKSPPFLAPSRPTSLPLYPEPTVYPLTHTCCCCYTYYFLTFQKKFPTFSKLWNSAMEGDSDKAAQALKDDPLTAIKAAGKAVGAVHLETAHEVAHLMDEGLQAHKLTNGDSKNARHMVGKVAGKSAAHLLAGTALGHATATMATVAHVPALFVTTGTTMAVTFAINGAADFLDAETMEEMCDLSKLRADKWEKGRIRNVGSGTPLTERGSGK